MITPLGFTQRKYPQYMCIDYIIKILSIGLIIIYISCGSSPTKDEDREQNVEQPDLKNMVLIPAGEFLMGSPEGEGVFDEHPQHKVYLDAFYIDKYEVTNAQFKNFVAATGYVRFAHRPVCLRHRQATSSYGDGC